MTLHSGDVICLAEEQFLNDQILDFWMWWISVTKLSEKDRERTHIFSTFFYKSLTTRPKRRSCAPWENDRTLTTAEKRHCRVKKWTKNVDIFSKDFIMVPINENAHWFMAVICFPGIEGICNMDDGKPRPDIKNRDTVKKKRTVVKDEEDEAIVDPDRDEEAGAPEEEIESETDDEVLADAEEEAAAEEEARKNGVTPNFDALVKRSARFRHPPVKQPCIITFDSMNEPRNRVLATLRAYVRIEMKVRKGIERRFDRLDMPGYNAKVPDQPNHYDCGIYLLQYFESFFTKPLQSFLLPIKYLRKWFPESIVHTKRREIYNAIFEIVKTEHPENLPNFPALKFKFQDETAPAPAQAEVPALPQEPTPAESPAPAPEPVPGPSKAKRPKLDNIEEDNE
jgi:sentrin-specific protease 7